MESIETQIKIEAEAKLTLDRLKAIFLLSMIEVKSFHRLPNGYTGDANCPTSPWLLAETKYGLIKIGWRKRVINIEWPVDANVSGKKVLGKDEDWITSFSNGVHAYGYPKAIEYLSKFASLVDEAKFASQNKN
jgi:hypothetical protein